MDRIGEWLEEYEHIIQLLGTYSLIMLVITLVVLPVVVMILPKDYFAHEHREMSHGPRPFNLLYTLLVIVKNLLGIVVILAGVAMLVLPGQGVLTILIGFTLTDFPGKFAIERWIVRQPGVTKGLNWIRAKVGKPPFIMPGHMDSGKAS